MNIDIPAITQVINEFLHRATDRVQLSLLLRAARIFCRQCCLDGDPDQRGSADVHARFLPLACGVLLHELPFRLGHADADGLRAPPAAVRPGAATRRCSLASPLGHPTPHATSSSSSVGGSVSTGCQLQAVLEPRKPASPARKQRVGNNDSAVRVVGDPRRRAHCGPRPAPRDGPPRARLTVPRGGHGVLAPYRGLHRTRPYRRGCAARPWLPGRTRSCSNGYGGNGFQPRTAAAALGNVPASGVVAGNGLCFAALRAAPLPRGRCLPTPGSSGPLTHWSLRVAPPLRRSSIQRRRRARPSAATLPGPATRRMCWRFGSPATV